MSIVIFLVVIVSLCISQEAFSLCDRKILEVCPQLVYTTFQSGHCSLCFMKALPVLSWDYKLPLAFDSQRIWNGHASLDGDSHCLV